MTLDSDLNELSREETKKQKRKALKNGIRFLEVFIFELTPDDKKLLNFKMASQKEDEERNTFLSLCNNWYRYTQRIIIWNSRFS